MSSTGARYMDVLELSLCIRSCSGVRAGQLDLPTNGSSWGRHIFFQTFLACGIGSGFLLATQARHRSIAVHRV